MMTSVRYFSISYNMSMTCYITFIIRHLIMIDDVICKSQIHAIKHLVRMCARARACVCDGVCVCVCVCVCWL